MQIRLLTQLIVVLFVAILELVLVPWGGAPAYAGSPSGLHAQTGGQAPVRLQRHAGDDGLWRVPGSRQATPGATATPVPTPRATPAPAPVGSILFLSSRGRSGDPGQPVDFLPHRLYAMQPDGSGTILVSDHTWQASDGLVFSDDGTLIAVAASQASEPARFFTPDGTEVAQSDHPGSGILPLDWSADGQWLLYMVILREGGAPQEQIFKFRYPDGPWTQLTQGDERHLFASWSPDGSQIAYHDAYQLWIMEADSTNARRLVDIESRDVAWSPDGSRIAFEGVTDPANPYPYDIWVVDVDGSNLRQVTATVDRDEAAPVWSPDSKNLLYEVRSPEDVTNIAQIVAYDLDTATETPLTGAWNNVSALWLAVDIAYATKPGAVQPADAVVVDTLAGLTVLFARDGNLWTIQADGSGERKLTNFKPGTHLPDFVWSPDGTRIALTLDDQLFVIDADGGNMELLRVPSNVRPVGWGGTRIVFLVGDMLFEPVQLATIDMRGPSRKVVRVGPTWFVLATEAAADIRIAVSPDGAYAAVSMGDAASIVDLATGEEVYAPGSSVFYHPAWTADSRRVYYAVNTWLLVDASERIHLAYAVEIPSGTRRLVVRAPAQYIVPSPDGKSLVYSDPWLKRMEMDANAGVRITPHPVLNPLWSPDGKYILYTRTDSVSEEIWPPWLGIYIVPAGGGEPVQLLSNEVSRAIWRPQAAGSTPAVVAPPENESLPPGKGLESGTVAKVTADRLNVRANSSTSAAIQSVVEAGDTVTILAASDDGAWLLVRLDDGEEGWVAAEYVAPLEP